MRNLAPALLAAAVLQGCHLLPAPVPMRSVAYAAPAPARCLVVFLPGAGDHAEDYDRHGFVQAVRSHGLNADVIAADATMGYYFRGMLLPRLHDDVLQPALARGYAHVWLVGISMGGMGSLMTAREFAGMASGIILLGPYLGDAGLAGEIRAAGGLQRWEPGPLPSALSASTYQRQVWAYLKTATASGSPAIYLGYGQSDRLAYQAGVLSAALPEGHATSVPGGHDWGPWSALFAHFLDTSRIAEECRAPASP